MILHQRGQRRRWTLMMDVWLIWSSVIVTAFFMSVVSAARLPSAVALLASESLTFAVALLAVATSISFFLRMPFAQLWHDIRSILPIACVAPIAASLLHVWNDGSGSIAFTWREAGMFLLTVGIAPPSSGPNILLRGVVLMTLVCLAYRVWRRQTSLKESLIAFVSGWVPAACVLLVPTWIALVTAAFRGQSIRMIGDADRVLGSILASSYWTNFQADRFFSGVGQQLETSIILSSSAVLLVIGLGLLIVAWQRTEYASHLISAIWSRVRDTSSVMVCIAAFAGYWLGFRMQRIAWTGLEICAVVVFVALLVMWRAWWAVTNEIDLESGEDMHIAEELAEISHVFIFCIVIGAFILGWPVALPIVTALIVGWGASSKGFGWMQNINMRPLIWGVLAACFVMAGGAFAARSMMMPTTLFGLAVAWASLVAAGMSAAGFNAEPSSWVRRLWPFAVSCLVCAWFLKLPIVLALGALCLLGLYKLQTKLDFWERYAFFCWAGFGILVSVFFILR